MSQRSDMLAEPSRAAHCGFGCPQCGALGTRVIDTRPLARHTVLRRRRLCVSCEWRFTTYERETTAIDLIVNEARAQMQVLAALLERIASGYHGPEEP
jgi:transcriptional regulator NrdR family protein